MIDRMQLPDAEYSKFRSLIARKTGMAVMESRRPDVERLVAKLVSQFRLVDTAELYRSLAGPGGNPRLWDSLLSQLTVNETYFLRDEAQFDRLEHHILPALIAARRAERRLRLWSAGCASGEEPYSLAVLLQRLLPDIARWDILILGTDISRHALDTARRATYGHWSFRGTPASFRERYFVPQDGRFCLVPWVRRLVTLEYLNLAEGLYPSTVTNTHEMDIILCRNVLMYFDAETARRVMGHLSDSLVAGGWLLTGPADSLLHIDQGLMPNVQGGPFAYQKINNPRADSTRSDADVYPASGSPPVRENAQRADGPLHPRAVPRALPAGSSRSTEGAASLHERLAQLERVAGLQPGDADAPYRIAQIHADRLELPDALRWIEVALERDPTLAHGHYLHGLILHSAGQTEAALAAFRRSACADPGLPMAHFMLASLYQSLGQPDRARKASETVARLLDGRSRTEPVPFGDGLTVGDLCELMAQQSETANDLRSQVQP